MENLSDVLLFHAVQAWCEDCGGEQLLVPVDEDGRAGGLCCSVCDSAVFLVSPLDEPADQRRSA